MMIMKVKFHWWRKPEYPEETTNLQQVTDETFTHMTHAQSQYRTQAAVVWSLVIQRLSSLGYQSPPPPFTWEHQHNGYINLIKIGIKELWMK